MITEDRISGYRATSCLLIDDDPEDREIFLMAVRELQPELDCRTAKSAEEGIEQLSSGGFRPDIIFLDLNMPGMTGLECLKVLRSISLLDNVPIAVYTTSSEERDSEATKRAGANYFITKPSRFDQLLEVLRKLFSLAHA